MLLVVLRRLEDNFKRAIRQKGTAMKGFHLSVQKTSFTRRKGGEGD